MATHRPVGTSKKRTVVSDILSKSMKVVFSDPGLHDKTIEDEGDFCTLVLNHGGEHTMAECHDSKLLASRRLGEQWDFDTFEYGDRLVRNRLDRMDYANE